MGVNYARGTINASDDYDWPGGCSENDEAFLSKYMVEFLLPLDALFVANAILMGVIVGIGAYGQRYRHHPLIRFIYIGATTLFLPIVSYVVSTIKSPITVTLYPVYNRVITVQCVSWQIALVMLWVGLVQIVGTNATAIVAGDSREGRSVAPPVVQLIKAIWTSYLAYITIESGLNPSGYIRWSEYSFLDPVPFLLVGPPYALILAKLLFRYYAWYKAMRSLAFGRNPRLIVGYIAQLQDGIHHVELVSDNGVPPPLIVMGEDTISVEKQPQGYSLAGMNNSGIVTIDRVWQLDDTLLIPRPSESKDLCLAFALFKMLRCRFVRYTMNEAGFVEASNFIRNVLLEDGDEERVLGMIAHELSFLHDYYYTSLPVSYSKTWLPILSVSISLLSIAYCLFALIIMVILLWQSSETKYMQIRCNQVGCSTQYATRSMQHDNLHFGDMTYSFVSVCLLAALGVLVEVREIASYIFSNWTKVALICSYLKHTSWQQSRTIRKCIGYVLCTRCKLLDNWKDKMNQCSILMLHPRRNPIALLRRLLHLPDQKKKVPRAVKGAVVNAVRRYDRRRIGHRSNLRVPPPPIKVGDGLLWTFHCAKGVADAMLVCHIATSILEGKSSRRLNQQQPLSNHEIVAAHLSRYCAYLVAYSPELLPDDALWCRSLYKAVEKDATRVLGRGGLRVSMTMSEMEDQQLVKLLTAGSKHQVLKDGAELGARLAELPEGEEVAWKALSDFWSEMIVCVAAACDNIDEHAEAVARGGELVTLLWALLAHVGSVDDDTAAATQGATAGV